MSPHSNRATALSPGARDLQQQDACVLIRLVTTRGLRESKFLGE
jgi:hypothetical protein